MLLYDSSLLSFCFTFGNIIYFVEEFVIDGLLPWIISDTEATDLLQKLSLDSPTKSKAQDASEVGKKVCLL